MYLDSMLTIIAEKAKAEMAKVVGDARQRGGQMHGIWWLEVAGRGDNESWLELRVRHDPKTREVQAELREYQSMKRGGQVLMVGQVAHVYQQPEQVEGHIVSDIERWVARFVAAQEATR